MKLNKTVGMSVILIFSVGERIGAPENRFVGLLNLHIRGMDQEVPIMVRRYYC